MADKIDLYDEFATYYDLMVDWESRLRSEGDFLRSVLDQAKTRKVLDLACGTGMHAILFARWGFEVVAVDPSENMLEVASANAKNAGVEVQFVQAAFGEVAAKTTGQFDVVFCLGNSLPHLLTRRALASALSDVYATLTSGGKFVTQNRNYDKVWAEKMRFTPLEAVERDGQEYLFFRFHDFGPRLITFNIATMVKKEGRWSYAVRSTKHRPLFKDDLAGRLSTSGFSAAQFYGDLKGSPYDKGTSSDLVAVAERA